MNNLSNSTCHSSVVSKKCPWGKIFVSRIIASNDPVNKVDPLGLKSSSLSQSLCQHITGYGMGIAWFTVLGPMKWEFENDACNAEFFKDKEPVNRARKQAWDKLSMNCRSCDESMVFFKENYAYEDENSFLGFTKQQVRKVKDAFKILTFTADIGTFTGGNNV